MLSRYFPGEYCKSVFAIDYERLRQLGFAALIFDIDNTLVHHGEDATPQVEQLFLRLHGMGFKTMLITDNDRERAERFVRNMDTPYICDADKPSPAAYLRALQLMGVEASQAVVIGDQIFKDIIAANAAGIPSIMVKFVKAPNERWIGFRRYAEYLLLFIRRFSKYRHGILRSEDYMENKPTLPQKLQMFLRHEILFCDIHPVCFEISLQKEILKRRLHNLTHRENFLRDRKTQPLPVKVFSYETPLIKRGKGIDPQTQYNKAKNIDIACRSINGSILHPGEKFSFWKIVGATTKRKGYKEGRVINNDSLTVSLGGGLCNLGNVMHLLALHSPLKVTEVHYHSDALAPDHGKRVPMSSGTSVCYNYIDLQFVNPTKQDFQILAWAEGETLYAELRCQQELPHTYAITEEGHRFVKEGEDYYRVSKIYRDTHCKRTGKLLRRDLIRDNHSKVMFDLSQLPQEVTS